VQSPCFGSPSSVCSDVAHSISNEPNLPTLSPFSPSSQRGATKPTPFAHLLFIILGHILALPWSCSFPRKPTTRAFPSGSFHFLSGLLCVCGCFVKREWHSFGFTYFLFSSTSACFLQLLPLVLRLRPVVLPADFLLAISGAGHIVFPHVLLLYSFYTRKKRVISCNDYVVFARTQYKYLVSQFSISSHRCEYVIFS